MPPTHECQEIVEKVRLCEPNLVRFIGVVYRVCTPKYATESDLLTGEGSRIKGGRWNPPGIAAVYGSSTPETAMAESLGHYRYYRIPLPAAMPRVCLALEVDLNRILDLRDRAVRRRLGLTLGQISGDWRAQRDSGKVPTTQRVGEAVYRAGFEGLLAPSAHSPGGHNLVIFPKNLERTKQLRVEGIGG